MDEKITAIIAIATLGALSLWLKQDGMIIATAIAAIAGLAGLTLKGKL